MTKAIDYFLYPVEAVSEIPEPMQREIAQLPPQAVHKMVIVPPQDFPIIRFKRFADLPFGWRKTPKRVLIFGDQYVGAINSEPTGLITTVTIPLAALVTMELATMLLRAHVEFTWLCGTQAETFKIEFNAVGELLIRRQLNYLRGIIAERARLPNTTNQSDVSIAAFPLKYRNYIRYALLSGEQIRVAVYQPAIRQTQRLLKGYLSPNRAVALTNQHLLLVEDERWNIKVDYGVITRFVPINQICSVVFDPSPDATWVRFMLGAPGSDAVISVPLLPDEAFNFRDALGKILTVPVTENPANFSTEMKRNYHQFV
ncbi:MAG: hypothetical protein IT324_07225 [Anaerolineae bacterium]|nr:hypothetical protein [Anaerolineae bacterium]